MKKFLILLLLVMAGCVNTHPAHPIKNLRQINSILHTHGKEAFYKNGTVHVIRFTRCGPNKFCAKATGQSSAEMLSRQDLSDNVTAGNFAWTTSEAGSTLMVTQSDFTGHVGNNGSCTGPTNRLMSYSEMTSCRYMTSAHSPLVSNNSFQPSCTSWNMVGITGTNLVATAPTCGTTGDFDADGYFAAWTTGATSTCAASGSSTCKGDFSQSFSIGSAPLGISSESISFEYQGSVIAATGDATNCTPITGNVALSLTMNSTTITLPSLNFNNTWNSSGSVSLGSSLTTGTNTITMTESGTATASQSSSFSASTGSYICHAFVYSNNFVNVDDIVITATY